ncbi:acetolactate decarboxylase [Rosenbergiella sp. S61]|uniref:Alpha-acetolactate decarboxylase n=1 Tax=Rosenbergiella gaditana TaxID=2726987 RepID=A0ABS5SZ32_9GAMM|nr:acetolactate decarboxylase [Rosenbergiella gaditana]
MADHLIDCDCASQLGQMVKLARQQRPEKVIFQTSLMSALLSGVYDGSMTVADLLEKGDFGLGTFNHLDGELVAIDHHIYQLKSDGSAQQARADQQTPFAVMTFFQPDYHLELVQPISRQDIHRLINQHLPSDNVFCALRIEGDFLHAETRTVPEQCRPYRPMQEAITEQPLFTFTQKTGSVIGFRTPQYMQGINVAGYHEHFITANRQGGGHLLDYQLLSGQLTFGAIHKLVVDLPTDHEFLSADLHPDDLDQAIRAVES